MLARAIAGHRVLARTRTPIGGNRRKKVALKFATSTIENDALQVIVPLKLLNITQYRLARYRLISIQSGVLSLRMLYCTGKV